MCPLAKPASSRIAEYSNTLINLVIFLHFFRFHLAGPAVGFTPYVAGFGKTLIESLSHYWLQLSHRDLPNPVFKLDIGEGSRVYCSRTPASILDVDSKITIDHAKDKAWSLQIPPSTPYEKSRWCTMQCGASQGTQGRHTISSKTIAAKRGSYICMALSRSLVLV